MRKAVQDPVRQDRQAEGDRPNHPATLCGAFSEGFGRWAKRGAGFMGDRDADQFVKRDVHVLGFERDRAGLFLLATAGAPECCVSARGTLSPPESFDSMPSPRPTPAGSQGNSRTLHAEHFDDEQPGHDGMNASPVVAGASVVALHERDELRLSEFCRRCTEFFELVEGQPGGPETAAEILGPLPERVASGTKLVFGIERAGDLVALVELLRGFPGPTDWYVGLLVLLPELRRTGLGTQVWLAVRAWIQAQGCTVVRLVVQKQNTPARIFWASHGFEVEEEVVGKVGIVESPAWRMRLPLSASTGPRDGRARTKGR